MEKVDLNAVEIPTEVLAMVPADMAERHHIIPVRFEKEAGTLVVAMADPTDLGAIEDLRFRQGCEVRPVAVDRAAVDAVIRRCYGSQVEQIIDGWIPRCESYRPFSLKAVRRGARRAYHALAARVCGVLPSRLSGKAAQGHRRWAMALAQPSVKLTYILMLEAIQRGSSGIVLDLSEGGGKVSFEVENELKEIRSFSPKVARLVMRRLRRMAGMGSRAEEGLIPIVFRDGRTIEYRVTRESGQGGERLSLQLVKDRPERAD